MSVRRPTIKNITANDRNFRPHDHFVEVASKMNTQLDIASQHVGEGAQTTAAEGPLGAMLYTASGCSNGKGIGWVLLAVDNLQKTTTAPTRRADTASHEMSPASRCFARHCCAHMLDMQPRR